MENTPTVVSRRASSFGEEKVVSTETAKKVRRSRIPPPVPPPPEMFHERSVLEDIPHYYMPIGYLKHHHHRAIIQYQ